MARIIINGTEETFMSMGLVKKDGDRIRFMGFRINEGNPAVRKRNLFVYSFPASSVGICDYPVRSNYREFGCDGYWADEMDSGVRRRLLCNKNCPHFCAPSFGGVSEAVCKIDDCSVFLEKEGKDVDEFYKCQQCLYRGIWA